MRKIAVITAGRSDYGVYRPVLKKLASDPAFGLSIIAGSAHFAGEHGNTAGEIEKDGFKIACRVECLPVGDTGLDVACAMGRGLAGFAEAYAGIEPDIILALGDRFEMFSAVAAAVPMLIPVAHIHGGEITEGAIDDSFRHAITKMSHLHFVAAEVYRDRLLRMGEEPWRVTVSGAPSLDNMAGVKLPARSELADKIGLEFQEAPILVTYHPETRGRASVSAQVGALLSVLGGVKRPVIITRPNADAGSGVIADAMREFAATRGNVRFVLNLGTELYFSMMRNSAAMMGNSSSGIIEAAGFRLPVVNIGERQQGRLKPRNVIDCEADQASIAAALEKALSPRFRESLEGLVNPYGDGHAAARITDALKKTEINDKLIRKRFVDTKEDRQ